jgi:hypothetical protein
MPNPKANPAERQNTPANSMAGGDKSDATLVKNPDNMPIDIGIAKMPDEIRIIDSITAA